MKGQKFIAQVGLGYWGKNIFRNLCELGVLHTACEVNSSLLKQFSKQYPDINFTDSFDDILSEPEIEAVVISTPAVTHYELVKKSLLSGKDVFVEKPLALKVIEGEELINLAEKQQKILMVGHILQYHPAVRKLKELISLGELGKVQYIYSNRLNIGKLRTEENILWSFAPHDISVILRLVGEEPIKVFATGGDYLNKGIYDTTITILEFKSGIKGHIFVSWLHPYKEQKLIVVGSKAMAVFDDVSKEKLFLYPHKIEWKEGKIPIAQKADYEIIQVEPSEPLKLELIHFIECVKHRKKPLTDGYEGLKVLKILELAEKSITQSAPLNNSSKNYFCHKTAIIDEDLEIGEGTKIWHFSHILRGSKIGKNCIIGQNVMIGPDVTIGNRCKIQNNVSIYKGVTLEDEVFCGPSCVFTNVYNPRAFIERKHELKPTLVKRGATIGANATIICGITIGRYAFIGAGAVVNRDVEDYALVAGVPAKRTGWVCKCGVVLINKNQIKGKIFEESALEIKIVCPNCGSIYKLQDGIFKPLEEKI